MNAFLNTYYAPDSVLYSKIRISFKLSTVDCYSCFLNRETEIQANLTVIT